MGYHKNVPPYVDSQNKLSTPYWSSAAADNLPRGNIKIVAAAQIFKSCESNRRESVKRGPKLLTAAHFRDSWTHFIASLTHPTKSTYGFIQFLLRQIARSSRWWFWFGVGSDRSPCGIAIYYLSSVHKFHLPEFVHIMPTAARGKKGTGNQIWRQANGRTSPLRPPPSDKNCNIAAVHAHGAVCS